VSRQLRPVCRDGPELRVDYNGYFTAARCCRIWNIQALLPEQVRGLAADARTVLFALGIVLYELITGHMPFTKETSAETMAAILREDPPELATVDPKIPAGLTRLVQHCLEKNPAERFQSARDLAFSLRALAPGTEGAEQPQLPIWSPEGRLMLYGESGVDLQVGSVDDETRKATTIANSGFPDQARFSPDGRWIPFNAFESGTVAGTEQCQVFVSAYPPRGAPRRIIDHGGVQPIWRADGRELYYLDPAGNLMAIPVVQTEPNFRVGAPQLLFKTGLKKVSREVEDYAVADHGKRFLLKLPADGETQAGFTIVLNWPALLTGVK
jgi:hypothetical protein